MKGIRSRIAILLSLVLLVAFASMVESASAGQWEMKVSISCSAKRLSGPGLYYPALGGNSNGTSFDVTCGKGSPPKHVVAPSPGILESCQATMTSVNGKKPTTLKVANGVPNNCYIGAVVAVIGNCGLTSGTAKGSIHLKNGKAVQFDASWILDVGSHLDMTGTTRAPKPGTFIADVTVMPDRTNKNESCSFFGPGASGFKFIGTVEVFGASKPK